MPHSTQRRIAQWAGRIVLTALVALIGFAVVVLTVLPRATHAQAMTILTGSMTPKIPVGSVVLVRPVDPGTLHVGDIATYQKEPGKPEFITHRIIKIDTSKSPALFTFKGDANRGADMAPVPAGAIRGKVWFHVPYLGAVRDLMRTRGGLAGVLVILFLAYAVAQARSALAERRAEGAQDQQGTGDTAGDELVAILAVLPVDAFEGLRATAVARLLQAVMLDETETTFTLLVPDRPDRVQRTVQLLESFNALRVQQCAAGTSESFAVRPLSAQPALTLVGHSRDAA